MKGNRSIRLYSGFNPAQRFYNFGDALGVDLLARLSGRKVDPSPFWSADVLGPGSILFAGDSLFLTKDLRSISGFVRAIRERIRKIVSPHLKIWGAGFIRPPDRLEGTPSKDFDFCAVRGRLTLDILEKAHLVKKPSSVALGDPGLLYPILLDEMPEKKFAIGIVPHYVDKVAGRNIHEKLLSTGVASTLIDVNGEDSIAVLRQIASCQTILSSSLHGCIVSDAMGIPNRQIQLSMISAKPSPEYLDYAFKFLDYYSVYGITSINPMQINEFYDDPGGLPNRIRDGYGIVAAKVEEVRQNLLSSFPYRKVTSGKRLKRDLSME